MTHNHTYQNPYGLVGHFLFEKLENTILPERIYEGYSSD